MLAAAKSGELTCGFAAVPRPAQVSVHDRRQTQLTESQKEAARLHDYNGDRHSARYTSGHEEPGVSAQSHSESKPTATGNSRASDEAIREAENERDN